MALPTNSRRRMPPDSRRAYISACSASPTISKIASVWRSALGTPYKPRHQIDGLSRREERINIQFLWNDADIGPCLPWVFINIGAPHNGRARCFNNGASQNINQG